MTADDCRLCHFFPGDGGRTPVVAWQWLAWHMARRLLFAEIYFDMRLGSISLGAGPLVAPGPRTFVEHLGQLATTESQSGQQVFQHCLVKSTKTHKSLTIC